MRINHNIAALNTYSRLTQATTAQSKSLEKLSSGLRINRAGDDAAGLAISEKMRGQISGLNQASRNAQDGISLIQTAEGALNETHSILQRMRELAVQGANDTLEAEDRTAISEEITALTSEIDRIAGATEFNGKSLLGGNLGVSRSGGTLVAATTGLDSLSDIDVSGASASETYTITQVAGDTIQLKDSNDNAQTLDISSFTAGDTMNFDALGVKIKTDANFDNTAADFTGLTITTGAAAGASFQIGANAGQDMSISIGDMTSATLGVGSLDVSSHTAAGTAITAVDTALTTVSTQRAELGALQNRLEHTINNLTTSAENLTAAESRVRDVDMAKEMMSFTKNNILNQAATAMLAQANQMPQTVLQLLR